MKNHVRSVVPQQLRCLLSYKHLDHRFMFQRNLLMLDMSNDPLKLLLLDPCLISVHHQIISVPRRETLTRSKENVLPATGSRHRLHRRLCIATVAPDFTALTASPISPWTAPAPPPNPPMLGDVSPLTLPSPSLYSSICTKMHYIFYPE